MKYVSSLDMNSSHRCLATPCLCLPLPLSNSDSLSPIRRGLVRCLTCSWRVGAAGRLLLLL